MIECDDSLNELKLGTQEQNYGGELYPEHKSAKNSKFYYTTRSYTLFA